MASWPTLFGELTKIWRVGFLATWNLASWFFGELVFWRVDYNPFAWHAMWIQRDLNSERFEFLWYTFFSWHIILWQLLSKSISIVKKNSLIRSLAIDYENPQISKMWQFLCTNPFKWKRPWSMYRFKKVLNINFMLI